MNILSLFDGISCGRVALERAGIKVDKYYASEIDKYAMQISAKNYPDIIQLGDITKWKKWDLPEIDLVIGGSPCQGFSFAGKQLNFEDKRSKLFFEYVRILKETKPKFFLLENVKMKKEFQDIISENLFGVQPVEINSALVSGQNRKRLYWVGRRTEDGEYEQVNIPQPEDKEIFLKDILENGFEPIENREKSQTILATMYKENVKSMQKRGKKGLYAEFVDRENSHCIDANYHKGGNPKQYFEKSRRQLVFGVKRIGEIKGGGQGNRIYDIEGKSICLSAQSVGTAGNGNCLVGEKNDKEIFYRKLTPTECERLQTLPDGYTAKVSNTQRYKTLGNGWTVDIISHIFSFL